MSCAAMDRLPDGLRLVELDSLRMRALADHHIPLFLEETARRPGELEKQRDDLPDDFPHLFSADTFEEGRYFAVVEEGKGGGCSKIVGSIGLAPDVNCEAKVWLNTFSVAKHWRGRGIGSFLVDHALVEASSKNDYKEVHLITLDLHSEEIPVMESARRLYKKQGFKEYKRKHVENFGHKTSINVVWYKKNLY